MSSVEITFDLDCALMWLTQKEQMKRMARGSSFLIYDGGI